MARENTNITQTTINRALRMNKVHEIGDTRVPGLCLRIRRKAVTWALRCRIDGKQTIRTIGNAELLKDPDEVRSIALRGKAMIKEGTDPKSFFEDIAASSDPTNLGRAERHSTLKDRGDQLWTWEQLRDAFIENSRLHKRPSTYRNYKSLLKLPEMAPLEKKIASDITPDDVRKVRKAFIDRGAITQSKAAVTAIKAAFSWACEEPGNGVDVNPARDVKRTNRTHSTRVEDQPHKAATIKRPKRLISTEELGLLMAELEECAESPALLAVKLTLLTAQRRLTVASALKAHFVKDPRLGPIWDVAPYLMKKGRAHRIPLPASAWQVVQEAMRLSDKDSIWLFPKLRLRRKTDSRDGHMSEEMLYTTLMDLQAAGKPLYSPHPFTLHDFRRAFRTHLSMHLGFTNADAKLILDHTEGKGGDVTEEHYSLDESLPHKREIMEAWAAFLQKLP